MLHLVAVIITMVLIMTKLVETSPLLLGELDILLETDNGTDIRLSWRIAGTV